MVCHPSKRARSRVTPSGSWNSHENTASSRVCGGAYSRNEYTNTRLRNAGIEVITLDGRSWGGAGAGDTA